MRAEQVCGCICCVWHGNHALNKDVGAEKMALLAQHRFALHACVEEAFAKSLTAGCIPFVPHQGGPAEIVRNDELMYREDDEVVASIVAVLDDTGRARVLHADLAQRSGTFSSERIMSAIRTLVVDWLNRND